MPMPTQLSADHPRKPSGRRNPFGSPPGTTAPALICPPEKFRLSALKPRHSQAGELPRARLFDGQKSVATGVHTESVAVSFVAGRLKWPTGNTVLPLTAGRSPPRLMPSGQAFARFGAHRRALRSRSLAHPHLLRPPMANKGRATSGLFDGLLVERTLSASVPPQSPSPPASLPAELAVRACWPTPSSLVGHPLFSSLFVQLHEDNTPFLANFAHSLVSSCVARRRTQLRPFRDAPDIAKSQIIPVLLMFCARRTCR
jgi:hypothetical protein